MPNDLSFFCLMGRIHLLQNTVSVFFFEAAPAAAVLFSLALSSADALDCTSHHVNLVCEAAHYLLDSFDYLGQGGGGGLH